MCIRDRICIPNYDWKENHPLGKAEWIKVLGYLFDEPIRANDYFEQISNTYVKLVKEAQKLESQPTVFSGMIYSDVWYMPAGESFGAQFLKDARSSYCAKNEKGTGSVMQSFEQVFKQNQQTTFWVNVEVATKHELLQANPKYRYFKAFRTGEMYSYAHQLNFYWENSAIEPHFVLSDLIQIFHPSEVAHSQLHFYRKLTE
jgi:iron complex transport system substrate-binding protein